ncbi:MAG TPA: acetoin utilization protein AcuC [Woeseiaceae bacterium]|jgi:acetoin utilization protein AcuC|nr:acetoin utilization protein AcuC [Woeseiaceae bacterium]
MTGKVLVYKGKEIAAYGFGDPHPFGLDRHDVFHDELEQAGLGTHVDFGHARPARVDELALFHTAEYIDSVSRLSAAGTGYLDAGDTPAMKGIYDAASNVVGAVLCAVDEVMHGNYRRSFIPIAGLHHAARDSAAGFCVFNDCGIAAEYLRKEYGLKRIAYVDIDAHHGDGMFYGFEEDPNLIFADIHEDGRYLYPGTGHAHETGRGRAKNTKLNIPIPPGAGDHEFLTAWQRVEAYLEAQRPEFILMQCGADSLEGDPITHLRLTEEAHAHAAAALCRLADKHCEGRIIGTGGGGYNRRNLARAWTRVVQSFVET